MAAGWVSGLSLTMRFKVSLVTVPWTAAMAVLASDLYGQGAALAAGSPWAHGLLVVLASYLGVTAGYAVNDYHDYDADRSRGMRPDKAATHGVGRRELLGYAALLGVPSLLIMLYLAPLMFLVGVVQLLSVWGYSGWAKRATPWSNLLVVLPTALMPVGVFFAYTGTVAREAVLLGLVNLAFEPGFTWAGVARDVELDTRHGVPTLSAVHGLRATAGLVMASWALTLAMTVLAIAWMDLGLTFAIGALSAAGWLVASAARFLRTPTPEVGGSTFMRGVLWFWVFSLSLILDVALRSGLW